MSQTQRTQNGYTFLINNGRKKSESPTTTSKSKLMFPLRTSITTTH